MARRESQFKPDHQRNGLFASTITFTSVVIVFACSYDSKSEKREEGRIERAHLFLRSFTLSRSPGAILRSQFVISSLTRIPDFGR